MAKTIKEERLRLVLPILNKEMKLVDVSRVCPYSKRSLERWVAAYKHGGEDALEPHSTEPKTYRNETAIAVKERVIALRKKTNPIASQSNCRRNKECELLTIVIKAMATIPSIDPTRIQSSRRK